VRPKISEGFRGKKDSGGEEILVRQMEKDWSKLPKLRVVTPGVRVAAWGLREGGGGEKEWQNARGLGGRCLVTRKAGKNDERMARSIDAKGSEHRVHKKKNGAIGRGRRRGGERKKRRSSGLSPCEAGGEPYLVSISFLRYYTGRRPGPLEVGKAKQGSERKKVQRSMSHRARTKH